MEIVRHVLRFFSTNKSYKMINMFGLTTAFAAFLLIMVFVINEFSFDKFVAESDRIYRIEESGDDQVPLAISRLSKEQFPEIEASVVIKSFDNHWVNYKNDFFVIDNFCFAENSFFEIFSIPFIKGNKTTALNAPYSLVLSESEAKRIFGDKNPIGQTLNFKNENIYTVTAIIKDMPDFHLPAKAIASFSSIEKRYGLSVDNWGWNLISYVLLTDEHDTKLVENKMNNFFKTRNKWDTNEVDFKLRAFNSIYLDPEVQGNDETKKGNLNLLLILIAVGVFIIVIACINYINLSIAMGLKKSAHIYIRKVLGSSKRRIIIQYVNRSLIMCTVSLCIAFVIVLFSIHDYGSLIGRELDFTTMFNLNHITLILVGNFLIGTGCGIVPALYLTGKKSGLFQKDGSSHAPQKQKFNSGLITIQYTASIILICGTLLIFKQLNYIQNADYGLNKNQVLTVELSDVLKGKLPTLKQKLLDYPGIRSVSFSSDKVTQLHEYGYAVEISGETHFFNYVTTDPDFLPLLDVETIEGERFSWDKPSQKLSGYMVNEAGWKLIKNSELKERAYALNNFKFLGVVNDFNFESLHNPVNPMLFIWGKQEHFNTALLKLTTINYSETVQYVEATFKNLDPGYFLQYSFLDETFNQLYQSEVLLVKLLIFFSALAIFIASLGMFSMSSISSEHRNKEIGIRKVNGAKVSEILTILNRDFIKWVAIAFVIACPIAYYAMNKWLENFAYKTTLSWWIFALAGVLALGIALLTVSWQSWKAATRNPVEALRYE